MPWNKDGSRKKSAFYLKSGNKASYNDLQVDKESPVKWAFLAPLFSALGTSATAAAGSAAAVTAGKAVAVKTVASTAASKIASGRKKGATPPIISGEQTKIMEDEE
tara:strand:+ start:318 stop:635 length:318 start_codon:yes stop_codon:yes gene_type:complete